MQFGRNSNSKIAEYCEEDGERLQSQANPAPQPEVRTLPNYHAV
jgi:hypothetical protein